MVSGSRDTSTLKLFVKPRWVRPSMGALDSENPPSIFVSTEPNYPSTRAPGSEFLPQRGAHFVSNERTPISGHSSATTLLKVKPWFLSSPNVPFRWYLQSSAHNIVHRSVTRRSPLLLSSLDLGPGKMAPVVELIMQIIGANRTTRVSHVLLAILGRIPSRLVLQLIRASMNSSGFMHCRLRSLKHLFQSKHCQMTKPILFSLATPSSLAPSFALLWLRNSVWKLVTCNV
jgi:hypothetical protein